MGKLISYSIEPTRNLKFFILIISGVLLIALSGGCSSVSLKIEHDKAAMYEKAQNDLQIFLRSDHTERCEPVSSMELDFTAAKSNEYGIRNISTHAISHVGQAGNHNNYYHEYIIQFFKIGNGDGKTLSSSVEAIAYALIVYMDNTGIYSNISPAVKLRLFVDQESGKHMFLPISIINPAVENISYGEGSFFSLAYGAKISSGFDYSNKKTQVLLFYATTTRYQKSFWKKNKIHSISSEFVPQEFFHTLSTETIIDLDGEKTKYTTSSAHSSLHSFNLEIRKPESESIITESHEEGQNE